MKSEQGTLEVTTLTQGLEHPWALAFLPDRQGMLVTERPGNLRLVTRRGNVNNRAATALVLWRGSLVPVTLWAENPYGYGPAYRYVKQGMTGEQIVAQARKAVAEKRKGWRRIEERLARMTS